MLKEAALYLPFPAMCAFNWHTWLGRALLLDDVETARSLSPYLEGCQPAFATWLNQYDAARTPDERHVLGLLALMRFTSTEPTVRAGRERDFAAYDETRDNWWCSLNAQQLNPGSQEDRQPHLFTSAIVARTVQPDPPFLTTADRVQADKEIELLEKSPTPQIISRSRLLSGLRIIPPIHTPGRHWLRDARGPQRLPLRQDERSRP